MKQRSSTVNNKLDCENMHIHPDAERNVLRVSEKLIFCKKKGWHGQIYRSFKLFVFFSVLNQARRYKVLQRRLPYWPMCQHSAFVMECPENCVPIIPLRKKITGKCIGLILSRNLCQAMVSVFSRLHVMLYSKAKEYDLGTVWNFSLCRPTCLASVFLYWEAYTAPFDHSCNHVIIQ